MRTTLNIDDDVLFAARSLARREGDSVGSVISNLARKGLNGDPAEQTVPESDSFFGFRPLPRRGQRVTNELVDRLRENGPY